jgi:fructose-specific phosphotransferase system component IIB
VEKFPTDDTKKITAVEAVKSAQEAERLYTNSRDIAEVQLSAEDKEKELSEFFKKVEELKTEIENALYTGTELLEHYMSDRSKLELKKKYRNSDRVKEWWTTQRQSKKLFLMLKWRIEQLRKNWP